MCPHYLTPTAKPTSSHSSGLIGGTYFALSAAPGLEDYCLLQPRLSPWKAARVGRLAGSGISGISHASCLGAPVTCGPYPDHPLPPTSHLPLLNLEGCPRTPSFLKGALLPTPARSYVRRAVTPGGFGRRPGGGGRPTWCVRVDELSTLVWDPWRRFRRLLPRVCGPQSLALGGGWPHDIPRPACISCPASPPQLHAR